MVYMTGSPAKGSARPLLRKVCAAIEKNRRSPDPLWRAAALAKDLAWEGMLLTERVLTESEIMLKTMSFGIRSIFGFDDAVKKHMHPLLTEGEMELIRSLAEAVPPGDIVEIGPSGGASTVILARSSMGNAKVKVHAVDPHYNERKRLESDRIPDCIRTGLRRNLRMGRMRKHVTVYPMSSAQAEKLWKTPISLLWIYGDHGKAREDFLLWEKYLRVGGVIALQETREAPDTLQGGSLPVPVSDIVTGSSRFEVFRKIGGITCARKLKRDRRTDLVFRNAFEGVLKTMRFECSQNSETEVHSLVCHKHLYMYLLAVKSFLRFCRDVTVFAHDDGTLTREDMRILERHVKNIRVIGRAHSNRKVGAVLKHSERSRRYRSDFCNSRQLFDYAVMSKGKRIISLDSDVLFFRRPDEIIGWMSGGGGRTLFLREENPRDQKLNRSMLGYDYRSDLCIGLICFKKEVLDLELIEEILNRQKSYDWYTGQNVYSILVERKSGKYGASPLDPERYQIPSRFSATGSAPVFRHYCASTGLEEQYVKDSRMITASLHGE